MADALGNSVVVDAGNFSLESHGGSDEVRFSALADMAVCFALCQSLRRSSSHNWKHLKL